MPASSANRIVQLSAHLPTPQELERQKIDRLRELRAAIDALRHEQSAGDPLLAWVVENEDNARPLAP